MEASTTDNLLGMALSRLGRQQDALASYDRALAINRHDGGGLNARGWVLLKLERLEGAIVNFGQ